MDSKTRLIKVGALGGLAALLFAACSTDEGKGADPLQVSTENPSNVPSSSTPIPVADFALPNGNVVEFYDLGSGVLVSELGKAGVSPVIDKETSLDSPESPANGSDRLTALWKSIAPNREIPKSLRDIQTRWIKQGATPYSVPKPSMAPEFSGLPMKPTMSSTNPMPKAAAPTGCNNGCCDEAWLRTLSQCSLHLDYSWFLFNYGYSWVNSNSVDWYRGLVCAAKGTSSWKVNVSDGHGGTWSIPEAHYRTYYWIAGLFDKDVRSSVNTSSHQALHTYCGSVSY